jgi:lipopolysaccharide transport system permease protein
MEQKVNNPQSRVHIHIQPATGWAALELGQLWSFRDLLYMLALRDIKLRYKQTALGVAWVILQPLIASLIFAVIFGRFANLPSDNLPYLLFVYAGMLPWNMFSGALQRAGNSLIADSRLISKVYFPRISIPISSTLAVLLDTAVAFAVMVGLIILYHVPLTLNLLALPFLLVLTLVTSIGVSLFFSALNVYYRDFMFALPFVVQVWMYASPVVYSSSLIPAPFRPLYILNPLVGIIEGFRWSLLGQGEFPALSIGISIVISIIIFLSGAFVFQRVERNFADVI